MSPEPMGLTLLVYAGTAVMGALFIVGTIGALCLIGDGLCRLARFHRRRMAKVRGR